MTLTEFSTYLYAWNDWIIFPAMSLVALIVHIRLRKTSTLLIFVASVLIIMGNLMTFLYSDNPLHPVYVAGMAFGFLGAVLLLAGIVLYARKDYVAKPRKT